MNLKKLASWKREEHFLFWFSRLFPVILESIKNKTIVLFYSANGALDSYETHRRAKRGGSH